MVKGQISLKGVSGSCEIITRIISMGTKTVVEEVVAEIARELELKVKPEDVLTSCDLVVKI
jgi:hypothetical protein